MKVVIIVLVVVAAIFVVFVVLGVGKPAGGPDYAADSGLVSRLDDLLLGPAEDVRPGEISGACVNGRTLVIPAGFPCFVEIDASDTPVREIAVEISVGAARISFDQPSQVVIELEISPDDDRRASFSVFDDGGTLNLRCDAAVPCGLSLVSGEAA